MQFLLVFVHAPEDTKWISMAVFPMSISSFQLEIKLHPAIISYQALITEKHIISLEKPNGECKTYRDEKDGFDQCNEDFFNKIFRHKINCTIPGIFSVKNFWSSFYKFKVCTETIKVIINI